MQKMNPQHRVVKGSGRKRGRNLTEGGTTHIGFEMCHAGKMLIA